MCLTIAGTALLGSAAFMALPLGAASAGTTSHGDTAGTTLHDDTADEAPLSLAETVGTALAGRATPVSLTVTDSGPAPETDVRVIESLPVGVSYVAGSSTPSSVGAPTVTPSPAIPTTAVPALWEETGAQQPASGTLLSWSPPGTLAPGASLTLHFDVDAGRSAGTSFVQSAITTASEGAGVPIATTSSSIVDVHPLSVQEVSSGPPAPSGSKATSGTVTETVTVAGGSTVTATGLDVDVYLPAGVTLAPCADAEKTAGAPTCEAPVEQSLVELASRAGVDAPAYPITAGNVAFTRLQWTLPDLAAGATETFRYVVDVPVTAPTKAPADLVVLSAAVNQAAAHAPAAQSASEPLQPVSSSMTSTASQTTPSDLTMIASEAASADGSSATSQAPASDIASLPDDAPQTTGAAPETAGSPPPVTPVSTPASGSASTPQPTATEAVDLHVFDEAPPPLAVEVRKAAVTAPATRAGAATAQLPARPAIQRPASVQHVAKEKVATTAATKTHAAATRKPHAAAAHPAAAPTAKSGTDRNPFTTGTQTTTSSPSAPDPKPLAMTGADSEREVDVVLSLGFAGTALLASSRFRTKRQRRKRGQLLAEEWLAYVLSPTVAS